MLPFYVFLCFLLPVCWLLYGAVLRRALVKYTPFFFVAALLSVLAAATLQMFFRNAVSDVTFSGSSARLFLYSFVQTGLIEEVSKACFFFFTLNKVSAAKNSSVGDSDTAVFYFAAFFGFLFAAFETLAGSFYLLGTMMARMFTTNLLHPACLLLSASGVYFAKRMRGSIFLAVAAASLIHGAYNLTVTWTGRPGATVFMILLSAFVLVLWWKIAGRGILTGECDGKPTQL